MSAEARVSNDELQRIMAGVVVGEGWAIAALFDVATPPVRRLLLGRFQEGGVWLSGDVLEDMVRDGIVELIDLAPSWRPDGGAAPWAWARQRLFAMAFTRLGILADDLDRHRSLPDEGSDLHLTVDATPPDAPLDVLGRLATDRREAALLVEALTGGISRRDQVVWLDVLIENEAGNRSPAVTVAQTHGLSPALVRKICQRVRDRLVHIGHSDDHFGPLLDLPVLAA
jgi:hypothetical protein